MRKGGVGGGKTVTGLHFEDKADFVTALGRVPGYTVRKAPIGFEILFEGRSVGRTFKKYEFYKYLEHNGVEWKKVVSKRLLPDDAIVVTDSNTVFILEMKYQETEGSVDEKLQTCDFKRKWYQKILATVGVKVEYIYVLNDWFKNPKYKDTLAYVLSVGCHYHFEFLPLDKIGLPAPSADQSA